MTPITEIVDAEKRIQAHAGKPGELMLPISNGLLDPVGANMAIITDWILARGWEPDGFVQYEGYRLFRYKSANIDTPLER